MRLSYGIIMALALLLFTVSCKKSNPGPGGGLKLQGTWNFLFLIANVTASGSGAGITEVSQTNFKSIDNAGAITFTADSIKVNGLTYAADTTTVIDTYVGGVLVSSMTQPFSTSIPPTSETVPYKIIGTDSLYSSSGLIPTGYSSLADGGHFVITNDTLKITVQGTQSVSGVNESLNGTIYLKRQ